MAAHGRKKKRIKPPKPRIPVPKGSKAIPDQRKEEKRKACREKVDAVDDVDAGEKE